MSNLSPQAFSLQKQDGGNPPKQSLIKIELETIKAFPAKNVDIAFLNRAVRFFAICAMKEKLKVGVYEIKPNGGKLKHTRASQIEEAAILDGDYQSAEEKAIFFLIETTQNGNTSYLIETETYSTVATLNRTKNEIHIQPYIVEQKGGESNG